MGKESKGKMENLEIFKSLKLVKYVSEGPL